MKQSFVGAFTRATRLVALAAVGLALGAGTLLAQGSTGKVEGRVRDQAGAPIANAQVFVVGTAFNALTNPQGYEQIVHGLNSNAATAFRSKGVVKTTAGRCRIRLATSRPPRPGIPRLSSARSGRSSSISRRAA